MKSLSDYSIELGRNQVLGPKGFHWNNQNFINCLVKFWYVRYTLIMAYYGLVSKRLMTKIENLSDEEREKLESMTRYYADGKLTEDDLWDFGKTLLVVEYFLQ